MIVHVEAIDQELGGGFGAEVEGQGFALVGDGETEIAALLNLCQCMTEIESETKTATVGGRLREQCAEEEKMIADKWTTLSSHRRELDDLCERLEQLEAQMGRVLSIGLIQQLISPARAEPSA